MKLRRFLLISTALSSGLVLGSVQAAFAQDYDWTGFYAGVGLGAVSGSDKGVVTFDDPSNEITDLLNASPIVPSSASGTPIFHNGVLDDFPGAPDGFGLELNAGYNVEVDNFLFGLEASILTGPFKSTAEYTESGTLSYSSVTEQTYYTTQTTGTSYDSYVSSTAQYSTFISTITTLLVTTYTTGITTVTETLSDSYTHFQTTSAGPSTTYEWPTSTLNTVQTSTVSGYVSNTYTTGTSILTTVYSVDDSTWTTTAQGSWDSVVTGRAQIDWLSTIKGRVGFTADRTLFFATGGVAIAGISQETSGTLRISTDSTDTYTWHGSKEETRVGFVVGAGIEQAIDDHWVLSGEAEYFNLGTVEYDVTSSNADTENVVGHAKQTLDGGSIKLGIKYKF